MPNHKGTQFKATTHKWTSDKRKDRLKNEKGKIIAINYNQKWKLITIKITDYA